MSNVILGALYTAIAGAALLLGAASIEVIAIVGIGTIYFVGNTIVSAIKDSRV